MLESDFKNAYKNLNKAQKDAVDSIDGPVMVIAGPGTGKTQVLALRIANILTKTDTKADGILCLTFTNSGVRAMRARLLSYIGPSATQIKIATFHSFAGNIVDEFFEVLGFDRPPQILDDAEAISIVDEILENGLWQYLRPRGDSGKYFRDIKSLISLLKRENMSPEDFLQSIHLDISRIQNDPASISTRGESKGKLKKEIETRIEGLRRTEEIVKFYEEYESMKRERLLADYDDILRHAFDILIISETARADIRERYLYVLVDEHQDSSALQNNILKEIWGETELPNIFVVGDDRQLIYGFSGASIEYFEGFKTLFGKAKLITLVENYRSTQAILDSADALLQSGLTLEKLKSNTKEMHTIELVECAFPRDEIIACANEIKRKIKEGISADNCAVLVPKNYQVKNAVQILQDCGIAVAASGVLSLFESIEAESLLRVLKIIQNPYDNVTLSEILFDPIFSIPPIVAHRFLQSVDMRKLSIDDFTKNSKPTLLSDLDPISMLGKKFSEYIEMRNTRNVYKLIQYVGEYLLLDTAYEHETLIKRVEIVRTMLHLALLEQEKCQRENRHFTLKNFLVFIDRLRDYNEDIPLAVFNADHGVKVLTLHSSKGLEFDFVWIAHMDEKNLMQGKRQVFALPADVAEKIEEKDELTVKRQVYVALTRAKRFCTFSYSRANYNGAEQELAHILQELPERLFDKKSFDEIENELLKEDPKAYVVSKRQNKQDFFLKELTDLVAQEYQATKVSVTLLNNFFECPWKWYFRNLLRLPEILSESLIFGNIVHGTIEQVLKKSSLDTNQIILNQIHKQSVYDDVLSNRLSKEAYVVVSRWMKERLPNIEKDYMSERSLSYRDPKFPHLLFYGKIDLTETLGNGNIRVTDFKTGSVKTKSEIEKISDEGRLSDHLRQLAMYSYLISGADKNSTVVESRLEFLEAKKDDKNTIYKTEITKEEIDLLVRDVVEYDYNLKTGKWVNRPCHFKVYGKETQCVYCKMAEVYKK